MQKDILTNALIENDIKELYKWKMKDFILSVIFLFVGYIMLLLTCDFTIKKNCGLIIILILYSLVLIITIVYSIYLIFNIHTPNIKYSIYTDKFIKFGHKLTFGYGLWGAPCLYFWEHGKFVLQNYRNYYDWSENYKMKNQGIINSSIPGDEFYLVIKNNKIINIYNKKIFILYEISNK